MQGANIPCGRIPHFDFGCEVVFWVSELILLYFHLILECLNLNGLCVNLRVVLVLGCLDLYLGV